MSLQQQAYETVATRSGGMCEAMVFIEASGRWTRCGKTPPQIHHMLTRARGGEALDEAGETYHLVVLCPRCHKVAHEDRSTGFILDGYVQRTNDGPFYVGDDKYLRENYGRQD